MEPGSTSGSAEQKETTHQGFTKAIHSSIAAIPCCQGKQIIASFSLSLRAVQLLQVTRLICYQHLCIDKETQGSRWSTAHLPLKKAKQAFL